MKLTVIRNGLKRNLLFRVHANFYKSVSSHKPSFCLGFKVGPSCNRQGDKSSYFEVDADSFWWNWRLNPIQSTCSGSGILVGTPPCVHPFRVQPSCWHFTRYLVLIPFVTAQVHASRYCPFLAFIFDFS